MQYGFSSIITGISFLSENQFYKQRKHDEYHLRGSNKLGTVSPRN